MKYTLWGNAKTDKIIRQTFKAQSKIIDTIKKKKRLGKIALEILYTAAYCNSQDLPILTFTSIWGEKFNDSSEDLLLSSLDLLVKYQLVDVYYKRFLSIHKLTQSNIQLMLKEQDREEEVINRVMFLFNISLDESRHILDGNEISAISIKTWIPYFCSNAETVYSHACRYEKLREGQERKNIKSLLHYFHQQKLYTPGYAFFKGSLQ